MRSRKLTTILAAAAIAAVLLVPVGAYATGLAGPNATPRTVRAVDFEAGGSTMTSIGPDLSVTSEPTNAYWGITSGAFHGGSRSLWCAGALYPGGADATSWPTYPLYTRGITQLKVPELSGYYSSKLSFWYLMPSLGLLDGTAFNFNFSAMDGSGNAVEPDYHTTDSVSKTDPGTWVQKSFDWTNSGTQISRVPAQFTLRFFQGGPGGEGQTAVGAGPSVDDIEVAGFKYGPVRSLAGWNVGTAGSPIVHLEWTKPATSVSNSAEDTRDLSYRVWRLDTGTGTWTDLTLGGRVNSPAHEWDDAGVSANHSYRYFVQAWDPSDGTDDWGELASPVDMVFVADKTTATHNAFRDYGAGPAPCDSGQSVILQVDVTSHASGAGIPGMVQGDFSVKQAGGALMVGATTAAVTGFLADEAVAGRYYLTVTPGVGTTYYRIDYLGKVGGFQASTGSPVLQANVTGNTSFVTSAKRVVVAYGGRTTVLGTLSMGGTPQASEGDYVSLQALTAAGWANVAATINDLGNGTYSAVTPSVTTAASFRLHFAGHGGSTASTDLGQVDTVPYASLTAPSGKSTASRGKYYTATGTLKPGHSGTPVRIEGYQKVGSKWKKRWTKSAANANYGSYSKYTLKVKLAKGSWRLYATHSDSGHAATRTGYKSIKCR
jgi:hypothetical protein